MRRSTLAALGGTTFGLAGAVLAARAGRRISLAPSGHPIHLLADELAFEEIIPGVSRAVLRGDPDRGPYASFTRFKPGTRVARHTHPNDAVLILLQGAYLYGTDAGEERVEPGSYFVIPGGVPHWSGGDARDGCLFYQEGLLPFGLDFIH